MSNRWNRGFTKINAMSLRERALVSAAIAACLLVLAKLVLFDPLSVKEKSLIDQIAQQQEQIKSLQVQVQEMTRPRANDSASAARTRVQTLQQSIAKLDADILELQQTLVGPKQMAELLEQVLARNGALELVALRTLPVKNLLDSAKEKQGDDKDKDKDKANTKPTTGAGAPSPAKPIYEHGVEVTLKGSYADVVNYLTQLEQLPSRMFWGSLAMNVDEYPKHMFTLTIYTVSLDRAWLTV